MNHNSKRSTSQSWRQDNNDQYTNRGRQPSNTGSQRSYGSTRGSTVADESYGRNNYGSQRNYGSEQYDQHPTKNYGTHQGGMYGSKEGSFGNDDYGPQDGNRSQRTQYNNTRRNYGSQHPSGSDYGARNDWGPERSTSSRDISATGGQQSWDDGGYPSSTGPTYGRHEQAWRGTNSNVSSQDYDNDLDDHSSENGRDYSYDHDEDDSPSSEYQSRSSRTARHNLSAQGTRRGSYLSQNFSSQPDEDEYTSDREDMDEDTGKWGSQGRWGRGSHHRR